MNNPALWKTWAGACACFLAVSLSAAQRVVKTAEEAQAAGRAAGPGDEIVLSAGEYPDCLLELAAAGTAEKPVVLRGEKPGAAVFTGRSHLRIAGRFLEVRDLVWRDCAARPDLKNPVDFDGSEHCRVTGCRFEHTRCGSVALVVFRRAATENRLDHCRFFDTQFVTLRVVIDDHSLQFGPPLRNRIDHNVFQDVPPLGRNGAETIQIGQDAIPYADLRPETLVERNLFVHCDGEIEIISVKSGNNIIRENVFRDCAGEVVNRTGSENVYLGNRFENCVGGVRLSNHGHRVENNVIIGCREAGIRLLFGTPDTRHPAAYLPVYGCLIAHNTIVDAGQTGIFLGVMREARRENQMWAGAPWFGNAVMLCTVAPRENRIAHNLIVGHAGTLFRSDGAPDNVISDNWLRATGTAVVGESGLRALSGDPGFVDAAKGDYRLLPTSPARAAGIGAGAEPFAAGPEAE
jgi:poly(beta-D-mannuronate) lyase